MASFKKIQKQKKLLDMLISNDLICEKGISIFKKYSGWYIGNHGYLCTQTWNAKIKKKNALLMHRLIMDNPKNFDIDHINHNKLDNRACNIRLCNPSQNGGNTRKTVLPTSSKHKGVYWNKRDEWWQAYITKNRKTMYLGIFHSEKEAAIAYNNAALEIFGEFAHLNVA